MTITTSYLICTTPRTGSNFLCEVLTRTGVAGHVDEYLWNPPYWYEQWGITAFGSYLDRMLEAGQSANGVFGMKVMNWHVDEFVPKLGEERGWVGRPAPAVLARFFPSLQYVWLTRRDKVRQAVSLHRAHQTGIWRSIDADKVPPIEPSFDFERINLLLDAIVFGEAFWSDYFSSAGVQPLTVVYEDFIRDPERGTVEILDYLHIPVPPALQFGAWEHEKQADEVSDAWVRRYRELKEIALQRLP